MRRFKRRNSKLIFTVLILCVFILSGLVGYSYLNETLTVEGNTDVNKNNWNIHFDSESFHVLENSAIMINEPSFSDNETKINFGINLDKPGNKYSFTVDIKNDGKKIDINTLDYINELKTGALIEAAMTMGATLAGASKEEITLVNECASMIGQAFQIQDDILDVTSTTEVLGKPVLSDEKNNKSTYVNLLGIEEAGNKVEELSNHAIERLKSLGRENEFLFILIEKLINRNK